MVRTTPRSRGTGRPGMTYAEFWPRYLEAHGRPATRAVHYLGTSLALVCLLWAAIGADWRPLLAAPVVGYGCAWAGHLLIERNRPETFGHPFYSLLSDLHMLALWSTGRLSQELVRLGLQAR